MELWETAVSEEFSFPKMLAASSKSSSTAVSYELSSIVFVRSMAWATEMGSALIVLFLGF